MQAAVQRRYGPAADLRIERIDRPRIGPDEVLVEVHAAGLDRGVWHLMTGRPFLVRLAGFGMRRPGNPVLGMDVAGTVVATGAHVSRFSPGDRVFGFARGSFAEYAAARADKLALVPSGVSFAQAAVSAVSGSAALQALTDVGGLEPGQSVLVIGASGGVGSFAVQIAKAHGATVTAVASTDKLELVRSLGADEVIDYTVQDPTSVPRHFDLVVDIGGRHPVRRLRRRLNPTGTLVIVGGEGGNRITGGFGRQLRAVLLSPLVSQRLAMLISSEHHGVLTRLASHLSSGEVVPAIGQRFGLHEVPAAIEEMEAGRLRGKSVIEIRRTGV